MDSHVGQIAGEQLAQSTETPNFKPLHTISKFTLLSKPDEVQSINFSNLFIFNSSSCGGWRVS
jgi:hypothetical protein